jgi:Fe2+ transport system protein FeoA
MLLNYNINRPIGLSRNKKMLSKGKKGDRGQISRFQPESPEEIRLVELGFKVGAQYEIVEEAPFSKDPLVIEIHGVRIAVRRFLLNHIEVKAYE